MPWTRLEAVAVVALSVAIAVALIITLSAGETGTSDPSALAPEQSQIGNLFPDQGDGILRPGQRRPRYDSRPPTSGPHLLTLVSGDGGVLTDDQLLTLLAAGDVVIEYSGAQPPAGLAALADSIAGPFSPALAADGQAIVLARRRTTRGLLALAWRRMVAVSGPHVPLLRQFITAWLGHGAGG